jgi:pimeloyl-ACP methyl ester carboxylesterase
MSLTPSFATSPDGAKISYYTVGSGPSVLILHGAMSFALTHRELAAALSPFYTVHVASRRGRGLSDGYPPSVTEKSLELSAPDQVIEIAGKPYSRTYTAEFTASVLSTDSDDLNMLITATNADFLICLSSGALIALHALMISQTSAASKLKRIIIFEPPAIFADRPVSIDVPGIRRYEEEHRSGDDAGAMTTAMHLVQLGPLWIPRWIMKRLSTMMMNFQERGVKKRVAAGEEDQGACTMRELGQLLTYDFAVCEGMVIDSKKYSALAHLGPRILLLTGGKSPKFLGQVIDILHASIPGTKKVIINGVGHEVLCGAEMRGQPKKAVPVIRDFFQ